MSRVSFERHSPGVYRVRTRRSPMLAHGFVVGHVRRGSHGRWEALPADGRSEWGGTFRTRAEAGESLIPAIQRTFVRLLPGSKEVNNG